MQQINSTIVATALPQMATAFDTTPVHLSTAITSYILALAVFVPISGWLADRFGARTVFCAAILIFTIAAILCGLSDNLAQLTAARILQGVGGAMTIPVGRLVVLRTAQKSEFIQAMAMLAIPSLMGPILGAPIGGFITTYASWRWVFLVNVPFGIIGLILAWIYIENYKAPQRRPLDWIGFVVSGAALGFLMAGFEAMGRGDVSLSTIALLLAVGVGAAVAAVWHATRRTYPLIDLSLLRIPTFNASNVGGMWFRVASATIPFIFPLLFQTAFGMTAFASGLLTCFTSMGSLSMRAVAKPVLRRFGFRNVLLGSTLMAALFMAVCCFLTEATPHLVIIVVLLIVGFIRALGTSATNTLAYADIEDDRMSNATSLTQLVNQIGNAFGVAVAAVFLHASLAFRGAEQLAMTDFQAAFIGVAVLSLASLPYFMRLKPDAGQEVSGHKG